MATPEELATALAAAQKAVDQADLATLQAFQAQMVSGTFTVADFIKAFGALEPTLADDSRKRMVANFFGQFQATLAAFSEMVNSTARDAA